uniref:Uncharacterized protein n=1 Tax=Nelumbo nucifera TaxID=4432 RepID=A0A822YZ89_NELNU|nr:TPA_asm: hypothetical protein HUJ06_008653 [Nelumbo nucifera]
MPDAGTCRKTQTNLYKCEQQEGRKERTKRRKPAHTRSIIGFLARICYRQTFPTSLPKGMLVGRRSGMPLFKK